MAEAVAPPPLATPVGAAAALDPKAIEQEVQRQLAEKRQQMQKAIPAAGATKVAARPSAVPAVAAPTEAPVATLEPTLAPPPPTEPPPEPTEVAAAPPPAAVEPEPAPARAAEPSPAPREAAPEVEEVSRGDLVGPGPGVVEPVLLAPPRVNYPPLARQQRVSGRVVVLVLVNENGGVSQARVQQGIGGRSGIDGSVLEAVRTSRFRAATKNGIPVKMWRTVVVDVKP